MVVVVMGDVDKRQAPLDNRNFRCVAMAATQPAAALLDVGESAFPTAGDASSSRPFAAAGAALRSATAEVEPPAVWLDKVVIRPHAATADEKRILVLYAGGTLGMKPNADGSLFACLPWWGWAGPRVLTAAT